MQTYFIAKPEADLIVVGSGVAGLSAAQAAADAGERVLLMTANALSSGSSWWAQGGIAAAIGQDDRPAYHAADTLAVGASLNDRRAVGVLVNEGRRAATTLLENGVPFEGGAGSPDLGLEAGHGHRRILHAGGGATGEMVSSSLLSSVMRHECVRLVDNAPVDGLIVERGRVVGVISQGKKRLGRAVVIATGGYAGLWGRSTNPPENRGMGVCLAWRAGATLADLEFVQFHPTALDLLGAPAFLLSEALRGEGALLVNAGGRSVVDPLLPRDVVARAIARYRREVGPVYLSLRHLDADYIWERFSAIAHRLSEWGLDLARDRVPVAPAAHYCMGGVRTDTEGRTDVPGLYVAGEAACTGAQGANRLASNSLLECLVFGRRSALAALADPHERHALWHAGDLPAGENKVGKVAGAAAFESEDLGELLDSHLGVEREPDGLHTLLSSLLDPEGEGVEAGHVIAGLAARSALLRTESRGAHFRSDAPDTNPAWQGRILWRRDLPPRFEEVSL